jgi:radical SAM protein with 4Fe4S-binding SPASM domain
VAGGTAELPTERWVELVGELADEGCMKVGLTGGEVALREDFLVVAAAVKRQRMALTVMTNGTCFGETDIQELAALRPTLVAISLYAASADAHDRITGTEGSFERSLETLRRLKELGVACRVACVLMNENLSEYQGLIALAESMGCSCRFDPTVGPRADGDVTPLAHRVSADLLAPFFLDEFVMEATREGRLALHPVPPSAGKAGGCSAGFTGLFVEATGAVWPCIGLPPSLGNVADRAFLEVWRGDVARGFRHAMSGPRTECQRCERLPLCSTYCPRIAAAENGDALGKSARACEMAAMVQNLRDTVQSKVPSR